MKVDLVSPAGERHSKDSQWVHEFFSVLGGSGFTASLWSIETTIETKGEYWFAGWGVVKSEPRKRKIPVDIWRHHYGVIECESLTEAAAVLGTSVHNLKQMIEQGPDMDHGGFSLRRKDGRLR